MPKPASTRPAYKMLTCIYLCRTLLFFAPYADFSNIKLILLKRIKIWGKKTNNRTEKAIDMDYQTITFAK